MNKEKNTGGPAFPQFAIVEQLGQAVAVQGMTLRDYFAAKAMQGIASNPTVRAESPESLAVEAYMMADAMLKAREA